MKDRLKEMRQWWDEVMKDEEQEEEKEKEIEEEEEHSPVDDNDYDDDKVLSQVYLESRTVIIES